MVYYAINISLNNGTSIKLLADEKQRTTFKDTLKIAKSMNKWWDVTFLKQDHHSFLLNPESISSIYFKPVVEHDLSSTEKTLLDDCGLYFVRITS